MAHQTGREIGAALAWSVLTPSLLIGIGTVLGTAIGQPAWWLLAPAPLIMGAAGGLVLGRGKPWTYILFLAAIAAVTISGAGLMAGTATTPTDCPPRPAVDCDTSGYGLGAAIIFVCLFVSLLPGLAAGMAIERRRRGPLVPF
ncbi:MAG: hypothetical protein JWN46_3126 [Acidimicrobiales bacterium]|nr:hypothetical protein [Acidimicrobiales bacterium]